MADPDVEVELTDEQPAPKLPEVLTGFFTKFDPNDPVQVSEDCIMAGPVLEGF